MSPLTALVTEWSESAERGTWLAYSRGRLLTVSRRSGGGGWVAGVFVPVAPEGFRTIASAPDPLATRRVAMAWCEEVAAQAERVTIPLPDLAPGVSLSVSVPADLEQAAREAASRNGIPL